MALGRRARRSRSDGLLEKLGLVAVTVDPQTATQTLIKTTATIHGAAVYLRAGDVVTNIAMVLRSAGVGMTAGRLGLVDSAFKVLAKTVDIAARGAGALGLLEQALPAPFTVTADDLYYLVGLWAGGTVPGFAACTNAGGNGAFGAMPGGKLDWFVDSSQSWADLPAVGAVIPSPVESSACHLLFAR